MKRKFIFPRKEPRFAPWLFSLSWEQRKLGELIEDYVERTTVQNQYPVLTSSQQQGIVLQETYFADRQVTTNDNVGYFVLPKGYFTYRSRSDTDIFVFNRNDILDKGIISYYYPVFYPKNTDSDFLLRRLNHGIRSQLAMAAEGTGQKVLAHSKFKSMTVSVPKVDEQAEIGAFFQNLDRLITLHQRGANSWGRVRLPRFCSTTIFWEQREFGETFTFLQNNTLSRADLADSGDGARNIHYGDILVKFGECINIAKAALPIITNESVINKYRSSFLQNGDIVIADTAEDETVGKCAEIIDEKGETIISGLHTIPCRPTCDFAGGFLGYYMNSSAFHDQLIPLMQGIKVTSISKSALQTTMVQYPQEKEEQAQIGRMFQQLDSLITLHQCKPRLLSKLRKMQILPKNALLRRSLTTAWEQREFGEIVSEYVDPVSTPTKGYYRLGIKSHAKGTFHSYVRPGMELGTAQMHRVAANNFIVNITFGWEHAVAITTEDDAGKLVSHRFPQFSFSAGMVPAYFKYLILDEDFRHHLWLASPGGAGRNRVLKISEMLEYKFWVPSQEEQQKISILLTKLDSLITLHQRESELVRNRVKTAFWRTSLNYYDGWLLRFTSAWEQRKLGELSDKVTEKNSEKRFNETFTNSAESGIISQRDYFDHDISNSDNLDGYYVVAENDFVYNPRISTTAPVGPINRNKLNRKGVMSPLYTVFRTHDVDETYLEYFFKSDHWHDYMYLNGDSGARSDRFSIKDSVFMEMPIAYPGLAEQRQIGRLFDEIIRLITLHQREFTHTNPNTNYVKYYQRNRPLLCVLRSMDKSV